MTIARRFNAGVSTLGCAAGEPGVLGEMAEVLFRPGGTTDNSPAIYRWVNGVQELTSPAGAKESVIRCQRFLSSLTGLLPFPFAYPALKRRAIIGCPSGTAG